MPDDREPIYCDCCGKEVMAWRLPDGRIIINDRRHGEKHTVSLDLLKEIENLTTASPS